MARNRIKSEFTPDVLKRSKVAIVGYTDHRALAPFSDPEWEIWGLNDLYYELPEVPPDRLRWFQLHQWREIAHWKDQRVDDSPMNFEGGPPHPRDPNHVQWLARTAQLCPVYMMEQREEVPDAKVYPKDEAYRYFSLDGETPFRYFTNTISWMIALAIMEGFKEIGVYGVDMMMGGGNGSEYGWQRPSCEFFMGWARGAGIKVIKPAESDLLASAFVYGDASGAAYRKKMTDMRITYRKRQAELKNQIAQLQAGVHELEGASNTLEWQERAWMPGDSEAPVEGRSPLPNAHKEATPSAARLLSVGDGAG